MPKIDASGSNKTILAFLPNAGLAAYPQWIPTMRLLISLAVPFLVSDYNEEALELSLRVLVEQCGVDKTRISEIKLNPFREPVKRNHGGVALPSCSNGFYVICE